MTVASAGPADAATEEADAMPLLTDLSDTLGAASGEGCPTSSGGTDTGTGDGGAPGDSGRRGRRRT